MFMLGEKDTFQCQGKGSRVGSDPLALSLLCLAVGPRALGLYVYLSSLDGKVRTFLSEAEKCAMSLASLSADLELLGSLGLIEVGYADTGSGRKHYSLFMVPTEGVGELIEDERVKFLLEDSGRSLDAKALLGKSRKRPLPKGYKAISFDFNAGYGETEKIESQVGASLTGGNRVFRREIFFERLGESGITAGDLSEKEVARLEQKIAYAYPLSEESYADLVVQCYEKGKPLGTRVDFPSLISSARSMSSFKSLRREDFDSKSKAIIDPMVKKSSEEYLRDLQKGHRPAEADLRLIASLREMGLSDPSINALLLYVTTVNEGRLSKTYTEKIAATLVRRGVTGAQDALDELVRTRKKASKPSAQKAKEEVVEEPKAEEKTEAQNEEEIDVDAIAADLWK